jgi:CPA2 family monovalent cation:H+ antiporter-2
MPSHSLLAELVVTYALALALLVIAGRLRVPSIVALIVTGVIAGPSGAAIVSTEEDVELLAEVGIVLLLFMVGLEFSVGTLRRLWRTVVLGGTLQMALTAAGAGGLVLLALGGSSRLTLFVGIFVALSSTAIVLKELTERNQADSLPGRLSAGILLFQDLAIILLLALEPLATGDASLEVALRAAGAAVLAMALAGSVAFFLLPRLLRLAAEVRSRDAFTLAIFLGSIGTAWLTSLFGVSMALGAFLGGLVLGETEFSHQIHAELRPLRDVLASLFFVSMGMLISPAFVASAAGAVIGTAVLIIVVKAVAAVAAMLLIAVPVRVAVLTGITLAQVGEFSFLLGRTAVDAGIVGRDVWQVLLAAGVLTMLVTPALIAYAPAVANWLSQRLRRVGPASDAEPTPDLSEHVVIFGYGVGGRLLASALRDIGQPYLVVELNAVTVRDARAQGERIHFGDASSADALAAMHIDRAAGVVAMISDPEASLRLVRTVRAISPEVPLIVRTRYAIEAERLREAGATLAIAEELEASLEVLAQLMARLHVPGNVIDVLLETFRRTGVSSRTRHAPAAPFTAMPAGIREMPVSTHRLDAADWSVGRTLAEVDLRAQTGATVLAIQKGDAYVTSPSAALTLEAGDVLFLAGDDSDVRLARARLTKGVS